jgi:hypothetical protein
MKASVRRRIFENYGGKCHICGSAITGDEFDLDHMTPRARGGTNDIANFAPAHVRCNRRKQAAVIHINPGKQFVLSVGFADKKLEKSRLDFNPLTARSWLLAQLAVGKTDSSLAQRFHVWLVQQTGSEVGYPESLGFFLTCCEAASIKVRIINEHFAYCLAPRPC